MKKWFSLALATGLIFSVGCGDTGTVEGEGGKKLALTVPSTAVDVKQNGSETFKVRAVHTRIAYGL